MKFFRSKFFRSALGVTAVLLLPISLRAENTDPANDGSHYAYGENTGWFNAKPLGTGGPGLQVDANQLSGYLWAENLGWISLSCLNTSSCGTVNYGVTNNGSGQLGGYAWGENIGWINFAPTGAGVSINPSNGIFQGQAWSENTGWVSLSSQGPFPYQVRTAWVQNSGPGPGPEPGPGPGPGQGPGDGSEDGGGVGSGVPEGTARNFFQGGSCRLASSSIPGSNGAVYLFLFSLLFLVRLLSPSSAIRPLQKSARSP